jgi:hypothetical protein
MKEWIEAGLTVAGLVFAAGGIYWRLGQFRRDQNGIGSKVNSVALREDRRFHTISLILMEMEDDQGKRTRLADLLREKE